MTREELQTAAEQLTEAKDATDDVDARERLADLAGQLEDLATADKGPDHGRMARIQNALSELNDEVGAEATTAIDDAKDSISAYRETVEGV
jgi:hypothetical protein